MPFAGKLFESHSFISRNLIIGLVALGIIWTETSCRRDADVTNRSDGDISVSSKSINLEKIVQHHDSSTTVLVTNSGSHVIQITEIQPSCGCTSYAIDKMLLKAGESTKLRITVDAQDRVGAFHVDLHLQWTAVSSNAAGSLVIRVNAWAARYLYLSQTTIDFGDIPADQKEPIQKQITISRGDANVEWDDLVLSSKVSNGVAFKRVDSNTFQLTYTLYPDQLPIGIYKDSLSLEIQNQGHSLGHTLQVPVSGRMLSNLQIVPQAIYLGLISPGNPKIGKLTITTTDHTAIKLLSIDSPQILECQMVKQGPDYLTFAYRSSKEHQLGEIGAKVLITVATDKKHVIAIPVMAYGQ